MIWKLDIKHSCDILERYLTFGSEKLKLFFFSFKQRGNFLLQPARTYKTRFPVTVVFSVLSPRIQLKTDKSIPELKHKGLGRGWIKKVQSIQLN